MVQHLFGHEVSFDEEASQLGGEDDVCLVGVEGQHLAGETEQEAGPGTDLARHYPRLDYILSLRLQAGDSFEPVELVLFLAAGGSRIIVFTGGGVSCE